MPRKHEVKTTAQAVTLEVPRIGRDELNLADHPLSVLTDRADKAIKTLTFRNAHGTLTITSSDAYGLPTAQDADVMVALIQLTKQKNDFKEPTVHFTRYELLRLLGWPNGGRSYRRLNESLKRWHGVTLNYEGCWYDKRTGRWGDADIHIIESVLILDGGAKSGDYSIHISSFYLNKQFIENCKSSNLKYLDLTFYFSLVHPSSKRLYRFLDKRFYRQAEWTFDLEEIAFERVGLSRNYIDTGKIKEKLRPAIEELEGKGFIRPMPHAERYFKEGKVWKVRFVHTPPALALPPPAASVSPAAAPPLVAELASRGVTGATAAELVERHPAEAITAKIEVFDWLVERRDKRVEKSPAGYLVQSIAKDYAPPKGFLPRAERRRREEARQARERQAEEERRRQRGEDARQREEQAAAEAYWASLSPARQKRLEAEALADGGDEARRTHETMKRFRGGSGYLALLRRDYIIKRMRDGGLSPAKP